MLDTSALLAWLLDETGRERVGAILVEGGGLLSAVNLCELAAKCHDRGMTQAQIAEVIADMDLEVLPFDGDQALEAGRLRPLTRHLGLSLGDRACLATARVLGCVAVTADRAWTRLDLGIEVECVRGEDG